ncbi:MAG: hypothetical protein LBM00_03495 [Deltaproteobacteria bacterium]|nr:hypothetical protein [Deltaproteobacteria bacterium]
MSRANPGYLQYLEKFSMRRKAVELNALVSGSALGWADSSVRTDELLSRAGVWLHINPQATMTRGNVSLLAQFGDPLIWTVLNPPGIRGLYLAPVWGAGELWERGESAGLLPPDARIGDNEDVVQYDFAPYMGSDGEYKAVVRNSVQAGSFIGGDIIPAATGIGPDFFLAARDYRDYSGIYCMVEAPPESWPLLPADAAAAALPAGLPAALPQESPGIALPTEFQDKAELSEAWRIAPLSATQALNLSEAGVIPAIFRQETLAYLPPSGWAATGGVRGVDGNLRRWVYRYFGDHKRPVLNWADPSATARQILNAGVIRQVGIFGNALSGYSVQPFIGLESHAENAVQVKAQAMALEASNNLARQIRAYGGWSWLRDALPVALLSDFLESGPDFVLDSINSPAAETALLTGDAKELRAKLDEAMQTGIDFKRLAHAADFPRTTPAGLAAEALGLTRERVIPAGRKTEIIRGHSLLIFFKAMQPGLLMLSGQDLVGAMPVNRWNIGDSPDQPNTRPDASGAYALLSGARQGMVNFKGLSEAESLYGSLDEQVYKPDSFLNGLGKMLRLRENLGLAHSKLAGRLKVKGKGLLGLVLQNEQGFVIALSNFSRAASRERLNPAQLPGLAQALRKGQAVLVYGTLSGQNLSAHSLDFTLPGWEGVLIQVKTKH